VVFFAVYYLWFRRIFPPFRFSLHHVRTSMLKETISYGIHTFVAGLSGRSLEQTPSLLIGYFRSAADVAYFNFPLRLLQYASNAITNVGVVALPHSAALAARGQTRKVASLGIYANRYCLVLFMPLAIFLALYGKELFTVWLKPDFTLHSAPLLPVMIAGFGLTQAAQFCSGSILFGLAKQQGYSYALFGEAVLNTVATIVVLPKYGILGAAVAGAILMVLVRGLVTPWLLCRHLDFSFWVYMRSIFVRPLATALPVWGALYFLKQWGIAGRNWPELISAGAFASGAYLGAAYFSCLAAEHRTLLLTWAAKWWRIATVRFG
jgi:O-antigen/teichoic acid export membrane protein